MNNVYLVGYISNEFKMNTFKDTKVINFSMNVKNTGGNEKQFIDCTAFNGIADVLNTYCSKGSLIALNGYISTKPYTNKQGQEVKQVKVIATTIELLKSSEGNFKPTSPAPSYKDAETVKQDSSFVDADEVKIEDSDLPF